MTKPATVALTIAGVDPTAGAGMTADLNTFRAHGLWGMAAVTALTVQNTWGGSIGTIVSPDFLRDQIAAIHQQTTVAAVKTGMLRSGPLVAAVAELDLRPLVVDPVLVATSGLELAEDDVVPAYRTLLIPRATVITPNSTEAGALVGFDVVDRASTEAAARELVELGPQAVLITGGHLDEGSDTIADCLATVDGIQWLEAPRLAVEHTHGSGCVLSAAVCASLAHGMEPVDACIAGVAYAQRAVADAVTFAAGGGAVNPPAE